MTDREPGAAMDGDTLRRLADQGAGTAALGYAARGWPVLPIAGLLSGRCGCRHRDRCTHPAKHPLIAHGTRDATTDPATIRQWYAYWPWAGVGIVTGHLSRLVVLDVDPAHGGDESLHQITASRPLPGTLTAATGGGGRHYLFLAERPTGNTSGRLPGRGSTPGLDLRGDGGYIVAAPSRHRTGGRYHWLPSPTIAPAPDWLYPPATPPARTRAAPVCVSGYARAALTGELDRVRAATAGTRNDTLNRAAFSLGTLIGAGTLDRAPVETALLAAALNAGLPATEATRTIRSGLDHGTNRPR